MKKKIFLKSKKIISHTILICIILSLVLTGIGAYLINENEDYAIKIGNEKVPYKKIQQIMMDLYANQKNLDSSQADSSYLKNEAILKIINHTLLKQYAKNIHLIISDQKIKNTIRSLSVFNSEEKFNLEKLKITLNNSGLTLKEFVNEIHDHLLVEELIKNINLTSFLLPYEVDQILFNTFQERYIRTITYNKYKLIDQQHVSEADIYAEYKLNQKKYELPEKFNMNYILINLENINNNIFVDTSEVERWYKKNIEMFTFPEQKRYSVIQTHTKEEAEYCLQQIEAGEDFSKIARQRSKDIFSSLNSGDLGWISDDIFIEEIHLADLKNKNEISKIIKSPSSGYLIIKLMDIKSKNIQNLKSVYSIVENQIKSDKSKNVFKHYKEKIENVIKNRSLNLIDLASQLHINTNKTGLLKIEKISNFLLKQLNVNKSDFFNHINLSSCDNLLQKNQLYSDDKNILVFCVKDFQSKYTQPLNEIKDKIVKEIKNKKFMLQTRINLEKITTELNSKNSLEAINHLKNMGLIISEIQKVNMFDENYENIFKKFVFNMPEPSKENITFKIFNNNDKIFLVALEKISFKTANNLEKNILINHWKEQIISLNLEALLVNLRNSTKIKSKILEKY